MNISVIEARDLSEAWFLCLCKTLQEGHEYRIERGSYAGQRRKEMDFIAVHVKYPGTRPLVPDVPQGVPPPSAMEYVEEYLPYLMTVLQGDPPLTQDLRKVDEEGGPYYGDPMLSWQSDYDVPEFEEYLRIKHPQP